MRARTTVGLAMAVLAVIGGATACGGSSNSSGASSAAVAGKAAAPPAVHGPVDASASAVVPTLGPRVIRTAQVDLRAGHGRVGTVVERIQAVAQGLGGYVSSSQTISAAAHSGEVVLRVPSTRFSQALRAIEGLGRVRSQSVTGQDVTAQFIDLGARLVNARAQRTVLLSLMNRATTIAGSIAVENQLQEVELRIEELTGELRYLDNQTSLATITVDVGEAHPPAPAHAGTLTRAFGRSWQAVQSVVGALIVGAGAALPFVVLALIAYALWRASRRGALTRRPASEGPPAGES